MILFDVETTGLSPSDDYITELAAIKVDERNNKAYDVLHLYIRPKKDIPDKLVELTGITNEFISKQPYEEEVFPLIQDFFRDEYTFLGHNVKFDLAFLTQLYKRCNDDLDVHKKICTLEMSKQLYPGTSHKLGDMVKLLGIDSSKFKFHNALDDCLATLEVYNRLTKKAA